MVNCFAQKPSDRRARALVGEAVIWSRVSTPAVACAADRPGAVLDPRIDAPNQVPIGRSFPMLHEDEERDCCATVQDILGAWAVAIAIMLGVLAYSVLQEGLSTVAGSDTTEQAASLGSEGR